MQTTNSERNQHYYDYLVQGTNCTAAKSTLDCLRKVPIDALLKAIDTTPAMFSPQGLLFTWGQSVDDDLFKKTPKQLIREGRYAKVPILAGSNDDEGTCVIFPLPNNGLLKTSGSQAFHVIFSEHHVGRSSYSVFLS